MKTALVSSELDAYRASFEQEGALTSKLLRAYPESKVDVRPSADAATPCEIAWTIVITLLVVPRILAGRLVPEEMPEPPKAWAELIAAFEKTLKESRAQLEALDDTAMNGMVTALVGKDTIGEVRRGDLLRMFLHDQIHHRGQLAMQLRIAGGPVPAIYGGSKDEPWF